MSLFDHIRRMVALLIAAGTLTFCASLALIRFNFVLVAQERPSRVVSAGTFVAGSALIWALSGMVWVDGTAFEAVCAYVLLALGVGLCAAGVWHYRHCVRAKGRWWPWRRNAWMDVSDS